jgi:LacI family transcriptional regulator
MAVMFMRVMRDHGVIPGKDVSIVGYDDCSLAAIIEPPLTSVRTFEPELGISAVELLLSCIGHPDMKYRHIYVGTELTARASTATAVFEIK